MLGSFPPPQKRWCMPFYYPNFNNDMWRVFGLVFFGDPLHFVDVLAKTFRMQQIIDFLQLKGIGIFDTASSVRRLQDNASDKYLEVVTPTHIETLLESMPQCHSIVTTGQKATDTLCAHFSLPQPPMGGYSQFGQMRLYRMPSTSRAYPLSLASKAKVYKQMFDQVFE